MANATVNGVNLNYRVQGKGAPLVLMHGFSTGNYVWDQTAEWFSDHFQVIRHDHRGHGGSEKPPGPYRIQDYVEDLTALLNYLGLECVDLAGHSMGGRTALLFALENSDRLNRLLLIGASGTAPDGDPARRFEHLKVLATEDGLAAVFDSDLFAFALPEAWKKNLGPARQHFLRNTPRSFCAAIDSILTMPDLRGRLGEISVPVWACAGENDAGPLAFTELCEKKIEACYRTMVPGCGHYPMLDATEEFFCHLEKFLRATQKD